MALKRHKHHIGNRYIEVYRATSDDFLSVAGGASNEAQAFLSKGAQVIIRMRGLPYDCTAKQVLDFFTNGENPCNVLDNTEGVLFVKKPDGRATGDAFVLFASESDAPKALARHRESIGQRYIELFRSTTAEVQQVLNRSLDPKTYESNHQPPLISQLPPMQLSLLPQHLITSGTTKNCIRLRGLPYEALVEHILHFLDDFAKHIIFQGVHMVINAQGQPSGEAFIQMDSEDSARLCAQRKHHQFMVFGKKYRYIEVFQCSGDDMNMVLNGGLQSPVPTAAHPHPHLGGSKQPSLLSPGASVIGAPFGPFGPFAPPGPILASAHRAPAHHPHSTAHGPPPPPHPAAFYPHPLVYWPYPSPPVSPTTYFNQPTHSPTHVPGNHGPPMYSLDYIPAVPPTNYANPASPPAAAVGVHANASSLILSPNKTPTMAMVAPPKQYPSVAPGLPTIASITPAAAYHNKISLPLPQPPTPRAATNMFHHHYNSPTTLTPTAVFTPHPNVVAGGPVVVNNTSSSGIKKPTPTPTDQPLLAIDTTTTSSTNTNTTTITNNHHAVERNATKTNAKVLTNAAIENSSVAMADKKAPSSSTSSPKPTTNGTAALVTNHCVELYTS